MNLRALQNLHHIYRIGSFSAVAERAHVTLSTLSMQMKALEAELGVALFDRTHRPPRLTPLGRSIARQAQKIVEAQVELQDLCLPTEGLVGHFRLGFTGSASLQILPNLLRFAQENWPKASFEFIGGLSESLCQQVRADALDAAVVTQVPGAMDGVHTAPILYEPMVLIHAGPHGPGEKGQPFLHFQPRSGIGILIGGFLAELDIYPLETIEIDNIDAIIECVAVGAGFSLLPLHSVTRIGRSDIQVQHLPHKRFQREVVLITPEHKRADRWRGPMVDAIRDVIEPHALN